ncbi:polysaccharide biosynthesis tyrosine autokinase [Microbacterium sp. ARD32]|uniref:polysaccharide biosynthesis tyrosine autokinase n=1 Tax=Microbacterium sp. ARD32 TaxID=2962577 RepID=UPI002881254B|nr:polysaccharide biosynthesis tyrosine autokinase [Microbacterium sp. ARD32]MDT0156345.1 polysaccharide biosynthesis tyrosine autokinase [Microbacterium sp. ARD32]
MSQTQSAATRIPLILLQFWWAILLAAVIGGALAYGYSALQTPLFHSSASVYFSMRSATSGSDINQGSAYTQNQMLSFAQLAKSAAVLEGVQDELAGKNITVDDTQLRRMVAVSIPQNTVILDITVASAKPAVAAQVANLVAENLTDAVYEIAPKDTDGAPTIDARVIDPAVPAAFQSSPNKTQDAILGIVVGGLLAVLAITVWTLLDRRVRSVTALDEVTDLPVLGQVPYRRGGWETAAFLSSPNGSAAEAHRQVRSALKFSAVERPIETLAVTSSVAGEGKTTSSVNLALAFVEMGQRVLLIDADLRRPNVAHVLGLENIVGLSTVLVDSIELQDAIVSIPAELDVLVAGERVPNPAQLLASHRMTEVLAELRAQYDLLIIDTAPVLSVADATIISQYADSTIVVTNTRKTTRAQLERCLTALHAVGANLAGIVLNKVREQKKEKYLYTADS